MVRPKNEPSANVTVSCTRGQGVLIGVILSKTIVRNKRD
jgi:hypothetical protein